MQISALNNPATGVSQEFKEFVNNGASAAMSHGQVICTDFADMATHHAAGTAYGEFAIPATGANQVGVLGIVWDPEGFGVAAGQRGVVMTRGIHPAVKVDGTTDIAIGDQLATKASGSVCIKATPAVGAVVGVALAGYTTNDANGVIAALIEVR